MVHFPSRPPTLTLTLCFTSHPSTAIFITHHCHHCYHHVQFSILFGVSETSRTWLRCNGHDSVAAGVLSGTLGGMIASAATFPLSLVVRTLQTESSLPAEKRQFTGPVSVVRSVVRSGGAQGLFSGLSAELVKSVPAFAVSYATYDALRSWLKLEGEGER